jgi:DNA-binding NarL/FixJ family response regulator
MTKPDESGALERGRESVRRGQWATAFAELSAANREAVLEAADLETLALSAHLSGKEVECADILGRAHQGFLAIGEVRGAARSAFWLGFSLMNNGEIAQAGGWFARARRILDDSGLDCVERGYLLIPVAIRCFHEGDTTGAFATFREAMKIGERFGNKDLVTLARQGQGRALIRRGELAQGLSLLDEAMVAVTAGEISAGVVGGVYCSVIEACSEIFDLRRAQEWTSALEQWCKSQPEFLPYRSHCLVRRAEMLQLHGSWTEALEEACKARDMLLHPNPKRGAVRAAYCRIAELHRLRGEFDEAEQVYRKASDWGDELARPGMALLRLNQGDVKAADALIRQAVQERQDPSSRARALEAFVDIMLTVGDGGAAQEAAVELGEIARSLKSSMLDAVAARANGAVLLAMGDHAGALVLLRSALAGFRELDAPYDTARSRALIGRALREQGHESLSEMELRAACEAFQQLGAAPDVAYVESLLSRSADKSSGPLTAREIEVLKLVASGATNRKIATKLAISEKTVARHVSNIFTKLDLSSRAAATAYAYQQRLV